jgi:hypothetical protein
MYDEEAMAMKRLQIMIEPEIDAALERLARKERTSKAALIRRFVRDRVKPLPPIDEDPIWGLRGIGGDEVDPAQHDEVVYPR